MKSVSLVLLFALLLVPAVSALNPPCCSLGDVDGDGDVDVTDLSTLDDFCDGAISLTAAQINRANVDGDGDPCSPIVAGAVSRDVSLIDLYITPFNNETFPRCGDVNWNGQLEYGASGSGDDADAVLVRNHILGISMLPDAVTRKNADANASCTITTFDIVTFSKLYQNIATTFANCQANSGCSF